MKTLLITITIILLAVSAWADRCGPGLCAEYIYYDGWLCWSDPCDPPIKESHCVPCGDIYKEIEYANLTEIIKALELSVKHILPAEISVGSVTYDVLTYSYYPSPIHQLEGQAAQLQEDADNAKQLAKDAKFIQDVLNKCKEIAESEEKRLAQ